MSAPSATLVGHQLRADFGRMTANIKTKGSARVTLLGEGFSELALDDVAKEWDGSVLVLTLEDDLHAGFTHARLERADGTHQVELARVREKEPVAVGVNGGKQEREDDPDERHAGAIRTEDGFLVALPQPFYDTEFELKGVRVNLGDWTWRRVGETAVAVTPPDGVLAPRDAFSVRVTYPSGQGQREAELTVPAASVPDPAPPGPDYSELFSLPIRIESGPPQGGGGLAGDDVGAWSMKSVDRFLPGLTRSTDTPRVREALARLLPATPDQNLGIRAAGLATAGSGLVGPLVAAPTATPVASSPFAPQVAATIAGPFGSLLASADFLDTYARTALRDLAAIDPVADPDAVASSRAFTDEAISRLITEFRRDDGPEFGAAKIFAVQLTQEVAALGAALGVGTSTPASDADYQNIARFEALTRWVGEAAALVSAQQAGTDPRVPMIELRKLLAVVVEKTDQLELELTGAYIDSAQRRSILIGPKGSDVTLDGLLEWVRSESGQRLPSLLDRSAAKPAALAIQSMLGDQRVYLKLLGAHASIPSNYPPLKRARDDLDAAFQAVIDQTQAF